MFAPSVLDGGTEVNVSDPSWFDLVYSDVALLTQTATAPDRQQLPTSSSSQPMIMAVMLELLAVEPGMKVLEIGTGTGYNAALLAHRLGDHNIASIDIDPKLVESARSRLAELGYRPILAAGDGAEGLASAGPFDRILATCAVSRIPPAWINQLTPKGRIVAPLAGQVGPLMVLDKTEPDEVTGHFDSHPSRFMPLRPQANNPLAEGETTAFTATGMPHYGTTALNPAHLLNAPDALLLFCQLHAPRLRITKTSPDENGQASLIAHCGHALAEIQLEPLPSGEWITIQRGTYRLWDTVETAVRIWHELSQPNTNRLGITALDDTDRQYVWLDDPSGTHSWPLA
jgi:protein-L-isoaspartate(D-aspartate) O-methyltransferase